MNTYPFAGINTTPYNFPTYQQQTFQPQVYQQGPHMEIPRVSGEESIHSFAMGPNSSAIFVSSDPNSDLGWIVTTDSAAYKTITRCHITPDIEEKPVKASDLETRFNEINMRFNSIEERMKAYEPVVQSAKQE